MDLEHLISGLAIERRGNEGRAAGAVRICDITEDSRTVMPGSLYVARKGERRMGGGTSRPRLRAARWRC